MRGNDRRRQRPRLLEFEGPHGAAGIEPNIGREAGGTSCRCSINDPPGAGMGTSWADFGHTRSKTADKLRQMSTDDFRVSSQVMTGFGGFRKATANSGKRPWARFQGGSVLERLR